MIIESARVLPRGNQPQPQGPEQPDDQETVDNPLASIHVDELTPEMARQLDLPPNVQGVLVTDVDPDSGMAELQKGDVIEEINQQPVTSVVRLQQDRRSARPEPAASFISLSPSGAVVPGFATAIVGRDAALRRSDIAARCPYAHPNALTRAKHRQHAIA